MPAKPSDVSGPLAGVSRFPRVRLGHARLIEREMERGELAPLLERQAEAPVRCCLVTTADSRRDPGVRAFREWILKQA